MKRTALCLGAVLAALPGSLAGQVSAEPWFRAGTIMMTLNVGGAAFTDFERTQARPVSPDIGLTDFTRRVSAHTAVWVGGWMSYWIRNGMAVRAGVSYVPTSFTVWNDESAQRALEEFGDDTPPPDYASLGIWMADASLVFRFPRSFGRVVPYALVGGGLLRYSASDTAAMPPEARRRFSEGEWQTGAFMFGVGATIPLQQRNLLMSFELTNHMARTPLDGRTYGETFELSGIQVQIEPDSEGSGGDEVERTNHVRLALGITLPLR